MVKKVSKEEMNEFIRSGDTVNYLPHLLAFNPKNATTPIRVAFFAPSLLTAELDFSHSSLEINPAGSIVKEEMDKSADRF